MGSGSLQMAILAGLQGIRTAVCAQFPMHPSTSVFNQVKSRLHTAGAFRALGVGGLAPDIRRSLPDELVDLGLRTLPMPAEEHCGQAVCRWINAIYGCTHRHAQLNDATHRALNEMFGFGNIDSLQHLSLMMRRGLAVTHTGGMDYFEHPERIAGTRLLLLQGSQNYIFHPVGSLKTLRWLQDRNPGGDYQREVLPGLRPPRRDRREQGRDRRVPADRELPRYSASAARRTPSATRAVGRPAAQPRPVGDRGQPELLRRAHRGLGERGRPLDVRRPAAQRTAPGRRPPRSAPSTAGRPSRGAAPARPRGARRPRS